MAARSYDVVIVGGGVIGSAIAYFLASDPGFSGTVAVIERDPTYRTASSALSASGIRQQYSTAVNMAIGQFGIAFLRSAPETLAVNNTPADIALTEDGYLFLGNDSSIDLMRKNHALQRNHGVAVELLGPNALKTQFPWLSTDGVALGSLGTSGEGWFDGYSLLQAFRRKAQSLGVTFITANVTGLERAGNRIAAATLADGTRISCGALVNAAGPHARAIATMAGIALPVEARRRSVFVIDCRQALPRCPLVIDISGVWFRPEGRQFITGLSPPEEHDPENFELNVDHAQFEDEIWPALAQRVPAFESLKVTSSWAGHYEYNTFDQNGIVGPHPDVGNLYLANGFSGHGLQQSPAVGRALAEWIAHGSCRSLDLSPLSIGRILENKPLIERNVV
ncbi:MAG TPA: FAD-binding oxidoreductase [Magnetospirillaceae bacterium]|jgi:glycine/D-amino acid oxidase-like deaminating enzyme